MPHSFTRESNFRVSMAGSLFSACFLKLLLIPLFLGGLSDRKLDFTVLGEDSSCPPAAFFRFVPPLSGTILEGFAFPPLLSRFPFRSLMLLRVSICVLESTAVHEYT